MMVDTSDLYFATIDKKNITKTDNHKIQGNKSKVTVVFSNLVCFILNESQSYPLIKKQRVITNVKKKLYAVL